MFKFHYCILLILLAGLCAGCQSLRSKPDGDILGQAPTAPADPWIEELARTANVPPAAVPIPNTFPALPPNAMPSDPWERPQNAVSLEQAAQKEEKAAQERKKLEELANTQTNPKVRTPEYLQPLSNWDGPFANQEKKQSLEREIVQQVGYENKPQAFNNTPIYDWEKEEQKGFNWDVLDPVNFFTKVRDWVGLGPDEKKALAAMKRGREILTANKDNVTAANYSAAAKEFETAAKRFPDSVLEEDALHLAGECYFFSDNYPKAFRAYQKLIVKYQHSKHLDNDVRRVFKIARFWEEEDRRGVAAVNMTNKERPTFDTFGNAKKAYETIFIYDANGPVSDDAVMALATAYLAKGRYQGDDNYNHAAYYYRYLRENFPLSKHLAKAHENELFARTNAYMGAEHNGGTLEEAGKLADITLRQFGGELQAGEKEEIIELKENVLVKQAEREWTMGNFYEKKKYYGSAKLYYEKILEKYPQTPVAEKARERLAAIQDKPDQPKSNGFLKAVLKPLEKI
jgi:outer membrane protein assembly factor BamD (BamD/ComL family)